MKRFLITTALESTWSDQEPVLFLGEWCRRYSRAERWKQMDAQVLPYHWDSRDKLFSDYRYLSELCERLLRDLTGQMNEIHRVDHGTRYWRIFLGSWLTCFVQVLYDRWSCIHQAASGFNISETVILAGNEESLVPNDMVDYYARCCFSDEWNHFLYGCILTNFTTIPCRTHTLDVPMRKGASTAGAPGGKWKWKLPSKLDIYMRLAPLLMPDDNAFILKSYMQPHDELHLQRKLGRVPLLWHSYPLARTAADATRRQWRLEGASESDFEECARMLIARQIPTTYLEGYPSLMKAIRGLPWPKHPRVIWTSSAYEEDEVFKGWAAEKVEEGSPLVIGQHGGLYGTAKWSTSEDHEMAISDAYMSWGWGNQGGGGKVKPVGMLKKASPLGVDHAKQAGALLVTCAMGRWSFRLDSAFIASQWISYFDDQCTFVENLPAHIRNALTVRLLPQDHGWDQEARWVDRFPNANLDDGRSPIQDLMRRSRLYIATYNATTFLESFAMDMPTIMFWNPKHWELRKTAAPYFDDLKRVGIFHETPAGAARKAAEIWDDVGAWWAGTRVRSAVDRFKKQYCDGSPDLLFRVQKTLEELAV